MMLKEEGIEDASVLDGGYRAWVNAGNLLDTGLRPDLVRIPE